MKTNCIVCKSEVENWDIAYPEDAIQVHPIGGTVFRTYGHYGSTVFDPMDASYIEVVVCDECLKSRMDHTYTGVNEKYRQELDDRREEMDKLIDTWIEYDWEDTSTHPVQDKRLWYYFDYVGVHLGQYYGDWTFAGEKGFLGGDVTHWQYDTGQDKPEPPRMER